MLAPIRPSPTNPIRIASGPPGDDRAGPGRAHGAGQPGRERLGKRRLEGGEAALQSAEVDAQDRQVVRLDRREVALRLGVDQPAERVRPARDRAVDRVVGGELEEPAARRAALVELAGRVEEARPVAGGRRAAASRRGAAPGSGSSAASVAGRRGDERLEREVRVGLAPGEMAGQLADERPVAGRQAQGSVAVEGEAVAGVVDDRGAAASARGAAPSSGGREDLAREVLRLLDVRLVERVDPEDGAGDRRRDLPAERSRRRCRSDRRGRSGSPGGRLPAAARRASASPGANGLADVGQRSVGRRRGRRRTPSIASERLAIDRDDAGAVLAGALRDELLRQAPKLAIAGSARNVSLSRPALASAPMREAEAHARVDGRAPARGRRRPSPAPRRAAHRGRARSGWPARAPRRSAPSSGRRCPAGSGRPREGRRGAGSPRRSCPDR